MRVYHFLNAEHGLDALRNCHLKIARFGELNDPFELLGVDLSDKDIRQAFKKIKIALAEYRGLLCFSRRWRNPLLWSHYADRHKGLCLGFDIPDELAIRVTYTARRLMPTDLFFPDNAVREGAIAKILATKFSHWRYEDEVRLFVSLEDRDPQNGHYFYDFSEDLKLAQVIVGPQSSISRYDLEGVLGNENAHVERLKARPAFKTFRVVMNREESLWT
ncbi:DUF2971 domain-containing protein [Shumkonia mesophila]|uniref:DUF2971 domain-containing protein n=1 Tax=Shumkonia mesophila TaxID=2838854 RepID=UPI002934ED13|nr:DUF2971 domain-containing protein [Shumkonia mesophila]